MPTTLVLSVREERVASSLLVRWESVRELQSAIPALRNRIDGISIPIWCRDGMARRLSPRKGCDHADAAMAGGPRSASMRPTVAGGRAEQ
jgi:hypothetical protein